MKLRKQIKKIIFLISASPPESKQNTLEKTFVRKNIRNTFSLLFAYSTGGKTEWSLCKIQEGGCGWRENGEDGGKE